MSLLRVVIACLVALVWAIVYLLAAFSHGKVNAPPELSGVMLAAVTFLFGSAARSASKTSLKEKARQLAKRAAESLDEEDKESREPR